MAPPRDYYEVLGVPRDASKEQLKRRYRELALQLHPDRNKAPDAEARFKEVSEAYAVLSDDQKRQAYDRFGHQGVQQQWRTPEDIFRGVDFEEIFGGFGFRGFEDIFESFFGHGLGPNRRGRRRGRDLQVPLRLTLEEVAEGARRTITVERRKACSACRGSGAAEGTGRRACPACEGTGQHRVAHSRGLFQFVQVTPCGDCGGEGSTLEQPCAQCGGSGTVLGRSEVVLDIPPGVEDGALLQVRGAGEEGPQGAPAGDLFVVLEVQPHPDFERQGLDLLTVLPVPFPVAVLGGAVELPLLGGKTKSVQVRAGTQGGTALTFKGLGLRDPSGRRGDLRAVVQIQVPTKVSARARELLRDLERELGSEPARPHLRDALQGVLGKRGRREP